MCEKQIFLLYREAVIVLKRLWGLLLMSPPKAQGDAAPSLSCSDLKLLKIRSERTLIAGHWLDLVVLGTFGSLGTRGEESIQECHFCHIKNKN